MHSALVILAAVVAGWAVQLYLSYQQSMAFNRQVLRLRAAGTVSVGRGGKRYRGGRAYVAIAVDDHGIVRDAISLRGFTTFARARPAPGLFDLKVNAVRGDRSIPQFSRQQREAARQAALLFKQGQDTLASV